MAPLEVAEERSAPVDVSPSAVAELSWLLHLVLRDHPMPEGHRLAELDRVAGDVRTEMRALFGPQGVSVYLPDTSVLADRVGALLNDEADTFLDCLEEAARQPDAVPPELRSETAEVREMTLRRLADLRDDQQAVRRYRAVLARVWDAVRDEWAEQGRVTARRTSAEWAHRLRQGAALSDLLSRKHILGLPEWGLEPLLTRRPRVVLSPIYFSSQGGYVVDLTSFVHVGSPAASGDVESLSRAESERVAERLKVLADGTRVAVLRQLSREPASVMDLSRRFRLAQPTVSNHVKLLRDAGLLDARKDGARVVYSASRERVSRLLAEAEHLLIDHC